MRLPCISLILICNLSSIPTFADSWNVTQTVYSNSDTDLEQLHGTHNSMHAVNMINPSENEESEQITSSIQSFSLEGSNLLLLQDEAFSSMQAINLMSTKEVTSSTQVVSNIDHARLIQGSSSSENIQAFNIAIADRIDELDQSVSVDTVEFISQGSESIQAGNYVEAHSGRGITQSFNARYATFSLSGSDSIQAGNIALGTEEVEQNFTANTINVSFSDNDHGSSIQAANYQESVDH